MTFEEAKAYIENHSFSKWKLGLTRARILLEMLGNPQNKLRFVHVAGSNGKGSTCAMLERILREAGYTTGFFPSPYIEDFRERFQICGTYISEEDLAAITETVRDAADRMEDHPTQFELICAIGMVYFARMQCDIVVLEVGLGGEYDATNVIRAPEVAVIARIGLEHTEYLGDTLAKIARTKSGIIKKGCDVVCLEAEEEARREVLAKAQEEGCTFTQAEPGRVDLLTSTLAGQSFFWMQPQDQGQEREDTSYLLPDRLPVTLSLAGAYQLQNVSTVLTTAEVLRRRGFAITPSHVQQALKDVSWPARFEVLKLDPPFILDGGHNPQCAQALAESVARFLPGQRVLFLMGVLSDKKYDRMIDALRPYAARFLCVTPDSSRALSAAQLADILQKKGLEAAPYTRIEDAVQNALAGSLPVVAFGSLYMAGRIRAAVRNATRD
ncbi:MAG: bifunctional folylpolyglutamate synthase/dihydrofolate synthase [Lachnospiraceae bacterium]|nr:bifunctional folylpolyglutamate synthase/dihydrofolate synthase [Lachnospiraceae bacterium]